MESSDGFVGTWEDVRLLCALRRKNNYAKRVEITHLERLPHEIVFEIAKHHPLLIPPLKNRRLRRAVRNYLAGGEKKEKITCFLEKFNCVLNELEEPENTFSDATVEVENAPPPLPDLLTTSSFVANNLHDDR